MQQVVATIVQLIQNAIAAFFRFFQLVYTWAFGEVARLSSVPLTNWPLWKQIAFGLLVILVVGLLAKAAFELWTAGENVLEALVVLLRALVYMLPWIAGAGLIAFGGLYLLNRVNV